jgi:hypothetical protein
LPIIFLFPGKEFLPISSKIQLLETSPQKQKEQIWKLKNLMPFILMSFPFLPTGCGCGRVYNGARLQVDAAIMGVATTGRGNN